MQVRVELRVIETSVRAKRVIHLKVAVLRNELSHTSPTILLGHQGRYSFFFAGRSLCGGGWTGEGANDNRSRQAQAVLAEQLGSNS
jgi:hypothetical protein